MRFLWDLLTFLWASLSGLTPKQLLITVGAGVSMALLCAIASSHYTRLWNKRYHLSLAQKLLTAVAAISTLVFVVTFICFAFLNNVVDHEIAVWETQLKSDARFERQTYRLAYYAVKGRNLEDFSTSPPPEQGGTRFPVTSNESRKLAGETYANEAYMSFTKQHPFFSLFILVKSKSPSESVKQDMDQYFTANPGKPYSAGSGIELAASIIREGLLQRSPKIVMVARVLLVIAFSIVQVVCFGVIGLAAFKDLNITT